MRYIRGLLLLLLTVIVSAMILQGCGQQADLSEEQDVSALSGAYLYEESITAESLYTGGEEAPVFIFTDTNLVLFRRDLAYYSPRSSLGRYYGSRSTYAKPEINKPVLHPLALLADAGVDTSAIQSCQGYVISENQLVCFLVDGQIWMMQYHRYEPYVFSLKKAGQLELQTVDSNLAKEETVLLVDTSAPQMLDIEGKSVTEQDVLHAIGVSNRDAGILVVYNPWISEDGRQYIVFEFEGDVLRSRAEYLFCNLNEDSYAASKSAAAVVNGMCNDQLRLLKTTYAYDVDLPVEYRGLNYEQLKAAFSDPPFRVISAVIPNYKSLGSFSFANLSPLEFWFASGAGGWCTTLTVHADGTFEGNYHDSDIGGMRLCDFTGKFSEPVRVNDYTYSVQLEQIRLAREPGSEEWKDGILITYCEPYGLDDAEELLFYLPGAPVEELPEGYQNWMGTYGDYIGTELPFYGLYNIGGEQGYSSHVSDETRALNESAQTAYGNLLMGDFSLLKGDQTWGRYSYFPVSYGSLEYATLDLDGDGISELLVQMVDDPCSYNAVFHYANGKVVCWNNDYNETSCRDYPLRDGTMVHQYDYGGARRYTLFRYQTDGGIEEISFLYARDGPAHDNDPNPWPYYKIDGVEMNEATFNVKLEEMVTKQILDRSSWTQI